MNIKTLQEIGLTEGETKVYFALLKLGTTKTGPLAVKAGVSSSKVYKILDRLEKKGLVGHIIKGKIKHYKGLEPKRILNYIEEKERQLTEKKALVKEMIPQLELEQKMGKEKTEAVIYEGMKTIKNFYLNILDDLSAGETYYVIGAGYGEKVKPGIKEFFQNYHSQRIKKKIKVKMLANHDVRKTLVEATKRLSEVRFLPQYLITNMTIAFYKKKAFVFMITDDPVGFLIVNNEAVKSFKAYFDSFWKIAKK